MQSCDADDSCRWRFGDGVWLLGDGDGHFLKFHYVARSQFFPSLGFYLAVHPHFAVVNSDVGLSAGTHQVQHFEEVVERDMVVVGEWEGHVKII
mgnify:CR=1 FL=1